ncbi:MAG TPA: hypothetical protein VFG42_07830 [Baekduia sp.]|uniref:hypothetical protein n=1 Tax=Baekduia sp. TaxID=2600305 RepID=UPI002D7A30FC|nr:hypothetical protein [Baekduia sp.]HET6506683.1 hypothetical protein [Baekduia sp.]
MSRLLLAAASWLAGLAISWTLYVYVVGAIGPVELVEVLLLTIPIALTLDRLARQATAALRRPRLPAPAPRRAGTAPRSR